MNAPWAGPRPGPPPAGVEKLGSGPSFLEQRRAMVALLATQALAGCGFELRRAPELPFETIAMIGFAPRSPLEDELRRALASRVKVVDSPDKADVVLQVLLDRRERSVVASTAAAQVRELQLRLRFRFQLTNAGGRELAPVTELLLARDMSYGETVALGKAQEESQLFAAMQTDIVQQVTRRLAQLKFQPARAPAS